MYFWLWLWSLWSLFLFLLLLLLVTDHQNYSQHNLWNIRAYSSSLKVGCQRRPEQAANHCLKNKLRHLKPLKTSFGLPKNQMFEDEHVLFFKKKTLEVTTLFDPTNALARPAGGLFLYIACTELGPAVAFAKTLTSSGLAPGGKELTFEIFGGVEIHQRLWKKCGLFGTWTVELSEEILLHRSWTIFCMVSIDFSAGRFLKVNHKNQSFGHQEKINHLRYLPWGYSSYLLGKFCFFFNVFLHLADFGSCPSIASSYLP